MSKLVEIARRGGALTNLEAKQMIDTQRTVSERSRLARYLAWISSGLVELHVKLNNAVEQGSFTTFCLAVDQIPKNPTRIP
jgi:hypothetical protein